ncbi:hypothetical protein BJ912DRAFT_956246 [Pholiota molesta]|nr:hypothetical protein BJ912DRAFT_956246 [Pholiota molesta]
MNANVLLRRFCRRQLGLKTVLMLGEQMVRGWHSYVADANIHSFRFGAVHGRGVIVRDIKPENFALGLMEEYQQLHLFDLGLSKLYLDPARASICLFERGGPGLAHRGMQATMCTLDSVRPPYFPFNFHP